MTEPITIGQGANKWIKDANTNGFTCSGYQTTATTTIYTCPVARKAFVLFSNITIGGATGTFTAQILANGIDVGRARGYHTSAAMNFSSICECCIEIAAGDIIQFITAGVTGGSACFVSGVETDA